MLSIVMFKITTSLPPVILCVWQVVEKANPEILAPLQIPRRQLSSKTILCEVAHTYVEHKAKLRVIVICCNNATSSQ